MTTEIVVESRRPGVAASPTLGLAAAAAVLFCLGQAFVLLDPVRVAELRPFDCLVRSGNLAVTMLLTIAGHGVTRALIRARTRGAAAYAAEVARYYVGIVALLSLVIAAVWLVSVTDSTDVGAAETIRSSAANILTFRWNVWLSDHALSARADLAPLWYFSVEAQLVAVAAAAVLLLGGRTRLLAVLAVVGAVASFWFGDDLLARDGWFVASLNTGVRAYPFLLGMAAALVAPRLRLTPQRAAGLCGGALLLLVGCVIASSFIGVETFFRVQAPVGAVLTVLFVVGADLAPDRRTLVVGGFAAPEVQRAGAAWRVVVAWCVPVFVVASHHLVEAPGSFRLACALLGVGVLVAGTMTLRRSLLEATAVGWDRLRPHLPARPGSDR